MIKFEKMNKQELFLFIMLAICSGMMIGIGATAFLLSLGLLGVWGRLIGSVLFSLGMFKIITYELRLFTGMVADLPEIGIKNSWRLLVCFLGNTVGILLVGLLVKCTPISDHVFREGALVALGKLEYPNWGLSALCSSILCGALITPAVWASRHAPKKSLSSTLGVIFPIIVFVFCGFDHSVANLLYFFTLGEFSWRVVGYIAICMVGNLIGGIILPLVSMYREKHAGKDVDVNKML